MNSFPGKTNAYQMLKALRNRIRLTLWQARLARLPSARDGKRLLHIGCGGINSPEFINLDARPMPHVHIVSRNIFKLSMIPDASLDMVYMSHVLEHVPRGQVLQVIKEAGRVLKADGSLRISVPDFDHILHIYAESGNEINSIAPALMGGQNYKFNFHYGVFNKKHLADLLAKGGFIEVRVWDPNHCEHHDFEDWASKYIYLNEQPFPISLNLEARKS